jgi:hypothetical protein
MSKKLEPHVFEKGDMLYIVAPVTPFTPGVNEIEEFAFAKNLKEQAPNDNLLWLRGQYVEADQPNRNGQMWTAGELAIKSVTPNFMPVTVMHDPRTAVGLIADTELKVPENDGVPRASIETALALWRHRFPDVIEEAQHNYEAGTLMQSMECHSPHYSCKECGQTFQKLPQGAERANWCDHLASTADRDGYTFGARILGNVTFTGTGLIFGTRGARGALDTAHLDVFEEQVAEYHESAHRDTATRGTRPKDRKVTGVETVEISKSEYESLQADKAKLAETETKLNDAETAKAEAEKTVETLETEKKAVEDEKAEAEKKVKTFEEKEQKSELANERIGGLGSEFLSKLGENTRKRVDEQAGTMSDDDWEARLTELEEMSDTKRDAKKEGDEGEESGDKGGGKGGTEFSREEVARSQAGGKGGGGEGGSEPSRTQRRSVIDGLIKTPAKSTSE